MSTPTVVDARGLRCPVPVIRLAAAARDARPGDRLTVWSTDPAARHDVPAWARMRGHRVVDATIAPPGLDDDQPRAAHGPDGEVWAITVEIGA